MQSSIEDRIRRLNRLIKLARFLEKNGEIDPVESRDIRVIAISKIEDLKS
jgi:hypothetical protein